MRTVIKVQNNLKEILEFLEEKGYKWSSGDVPTAGINWESKLIIVSGKTLTHKSIFTYEPDTVTLEQFRNKIDMKTTNILPGYKLILENGNTFIVKEYKNKKIVFPEGSSRSVIALDELCDENLCPKYGMSQIVAVFNSLNITVWERKFTRSKIQAGFTITNENGVTYLIVNTNQGLRIVCTDNFTIGPKVAEIMNEDMTPSNSSYAEIIEIKNRENKIIYKKG